MSHIRIRTDKPVAYDSPDHIEPRGTAIDNSVNLTFNKKLFRWIPSSEVRVLDLGCAGGGFVKSILDQGGFSVGVEGSDYSKKRKRAEWATIPDHLFTVDITEPFQLFLEEDDGKERPFKFNVITAWEVIEHIREDKLENVFQNISRHLSQDGVVIMSVCTKPDLLEGGTRHQTVQNRDWWIEKFLQLGFIRHEKVLEYFFNDWVRYVPHSFYVVMTRIAESLPFKSELNLLVILGKPQRDFIKLVRHAREVVKPLVLPFIKRVYRLR